jgi:hypothetical protein
VTLPANAAEELEEPLTNSGRPSGQRRRPVCMVLEATSRKIVAMRANGDTLEITGDGLKPAQSGLSDKAAPNIKIRRGAVIRVAKRPKTPGKSPNSPKSKALWWLSIHATAPSRRWWAVLILTRTSSTMHPSMAPAGFQFQALHLLRRAGKGLHPGHGHQRCAAVLRRRRHWQSTLGAEKLRRQDSTAP